MARAIDLTNQRFGHLLVLGVKEGERINGGLAWWCQCDCGTKKVFASGELRRGRAWSCGCGMPRSVNIAGQRFGRLVAVEPVEGERIHGSLAWHCHCDCGTEKALSSDTLRSGKTQSCGCGAPNPVDLTGQRFGYLTAISQVEGQRIHGSRAWLCRCDCGTEKILAANALRTGHTQSCGCHMYDRRHGQSSSQQGKPTPEYMAWDSMKQRCLNPRHKNFSDYGGRGITVCQEWTDSFEAFFAHVGPRPGPEYSLDRRDNERGYEPGNVRWTTWETQNQNQRPRTPGLKRPGRRKGPLRYAECHPDREHMAKGLCKQCYQAAWYEAHRPSSGGESVG